MSWQAARAPLPTGTFQKKNNNKNISTQFLGRLLGPHCLQALFKFPR
jgi:hypothetical protein